ncbi:spire type actin nucleation factor 2 [Homo sapiens]|uniref:Isoform 2 of Protein spire homolog 2 n=1 Tax=Homo sapiens TaxID=9606 RepID=Q8WWL2-2|nr:SPIRE2 protein [Homo sapiens]KAI2580284.1 spire type actin nucleation factor 2 [Homo sapiens]KAI4056660.1 spire type actin nucleation factor 2 [Homo sapiens]
MARAGSCGGAAAGAGRPEPWELSLEEVLKAYEQPLNEEQAWAVCFQGCRGLRGSPGRRLRDTGDLLLRGDGSVGAREPEAAEPATMVVPLASSEAQTVQSLGFAIYRALDWGLDESEERELSPQLERLIDLMANNDSEDSGCGAADEGYGGPEEEEEAEGVPRSVRTFAQAMRLCAARLTDPRGAQAHYQAVCRALFVETLELRAFLARVREAKEMLQKLREDEPHLETPRAELDSLGHTDWARLWVQLMRELRRGVKLKKVQEQEFNPLPTEFQLTPFEMLMQDIRARNYKLRKVMVDGDIPPRVKKDAHELILDFIRSRPPLKQVSERRLRPLPPKQRSLHEKILEEIKQERRLRPVRGEGWAARGFGSLPCILNACSGDAKSTSCINLSVTDAGGSAQRPRPRVLLKAPTLAEMEEMNTSEEEESPCGEVTLKRDRSFSEHDLAQLRSEVASGLQSATHPPGGTEPPRPRAGSAHVWRPGSRDQGTCPASVSDPSHPLLSNRGSSGDRPEASMTPDAKHLWLEFSHPVESLALTVEEVMDVRRVLVKAEMEKFLQNKELFSSLKKGKICCCCRAKFPLFSWPPSCLFCKRSLQGPQWQSVEEAFPHIYSHGCVLKDVCSECTSFVADVVRSSRKSVDVLNTTPRRSRQTQSLYIPNTRTLDFK